MRIDQLTPAEQRQIRAGHYTPGPARAPPVRGAASVPGKHSTAPDGLFACHHCPEAGSNYAAAERHARETGHARIDVTLTKGPRQ